MKVIILAGGLGTRLSEYTDLIPKPMVKIGNKPMIHHIMQIFTYYGYKDFVVALGYKGEVIKDYFINYKNFNSDIEVDLSLGKISTLKADNFSWNYENIYYLLTGNVRFEDDKVVLISDKAVFDNKTDEIEFFNPVKYIIKDDNNEKKYEINSENAFYNINTESLSFSAKEKRVRSRIYF